MANWRTYTPVSAADVVDADLLPYSDESLAAGSRTRTVTVGTLRAALAGLLPIVSYAGSHTIDLADDLGAHARITAAGTVTFPTGLTVGASGIIENATVSDTVSIAGAVGVTILSAGDDVTNGKWVAWVVVNTNTVAVVGAFADEIGDAADLSSGAATDGFVLTADGAGGAAWEAVSGTGDVVGPASAVDERVAVFDGTTGKLLKDGGVTVAGLATAAQGALADSAVQPDDPISINAQTGTTYTLVLADLGKLVTLSNAGAITLTVPTNASVAFPVGTVIALQQLGVGAITVEGATGVTINGTTPGSETLTDGQYTTTASLTKHATDTWTLTGAVA